MTVERRALLSLRVIVLLAMTAAGMKLADMLAETVVLTGGVPTWAAIIAVGYVLTVAALIYANSSSEDA